MTAIKQFQSVGFAALALIVVALTAAFWRYTQDDVFITYTYSRNLAEGVGFVFNPDERVQGTTTPLWTLVMAVPALLRADMLTAGNVLSGLFVLVGALLIARLLRPHVSAGAALAGGLLYATSPLVYVSFGMETLLYCALLCAAFALWAGGHPTWAAAIAGALTWTRADGAVLGGVLCLAALLDAGTLRQRIVRAVRVGIVYALVIAPWFLFAWAYFGSPLPNTFSAKQELFSGLDYVIAGVDHWRSFYGGSPISLLALAAIPVGGWRAWRVAALRPVVLWCALYLAGYTALNITNFWYYTPLIACLTILTVLGAAQILRALAQRWRGMVVVGGAFALLIAALALNIARAFDFHAAPPRMATYKLAGEWIEAHTPPDSNLLVADLGVVGFHARRRTFDSFGLITPNLPIKTPEYAVRSYTPDYVLATQYFLWRFTTEDWFRESYRPLVAFSTAGDAEFSPMTLYAARSLTFDLASVPVQQGVWMRWVRLDRAALGKQVWSGGALPVQLEWRPYATTDSDHTIFVHLVDDEGRLVAQNDGMPVGGTRPTSSWLPEERIVDEREIVTPSDLPPGSYTVRVGWYDLATGVRLLMEDGEDYLTLGAVQVLFPGGSGRP